MLNKTIEMPLPDLNNQVEMARIEGDMELVIEFLNMLNIDGSKTYAASTFKLQLVEDEKEMPIIRISSNAEDNILDISIADLLKQYIDSSSVNEVIEKSESLEDILPKEEVEDLVIPDWAVPGPTDSLSDFKKQLANANFTLLEWMGKYGSEIKATNPDAAVFMEL